MKKMLGLLLASALVLTGCLGGAAETADAAVNLPTVETTSDSAALTTEIRHLDAEPTATDPPPTVTVEYKAEDLAADVDTAGAVTVVLAGDSIQVDGDGVTVDGSTATVTSGGTYRVQGTLDDGQLIVETDDEDPIVLVLDGVDITSTASAPIYVANADKVIITLAEGSANVVTDGEAYVYRDAETDEPNAAIFSADDLTINGSGSLTVNANYNNGIASKDDLKITGGTITVVAVNDGVKGKDSVAIKDGTITITAGADGIQSHNDTDAEKGYVAIEGGTITIAAGLDGVQAESQVLVSGGTLMIQAGGGVANAPAQAGGGFGRNQPGATGTDTAESTKGLKAGVAVTIIGGTITVDAADDAVHSNDTMTIDAGTLVLATGDDGLHSENALTINGGEIDITTSYEGIESATITVNGGTVLVVSSDDGFNAVSAGSSGAMGGMRGGGMFADGVWLVINDGYVALNAGGDGLDSNGSAVQSGGVVIVNGPTNSGNGALDMGMFDVTGGFLVAVGSIGMAEAPDNSSTQNSVMVNFTSVLSAGTIVHIETSDGEDVLTFEPAKQYQSVVFSSAALESGETYVVYAGGSATGTVVDGLYTDGVYQAGSQAGSFIVASVVTVLGNSGGMMGGGGRRRP